MKYVSSEHCVHPQGVDRPLATVHVAEIQTWRAGKSVVLPCDDPKEFIEHDYAENFRPHDFDNCGNEEIFYRFDNGEAWHLEHSWWADYSNGWEAHYEHYITKIEADDPRIPAWLGRTSLTRDWIA